MTKSEYLEVLKTKLESINMELQKEIMEDYEQHFAKGLAAGKSEAEIIEELGSIEDMIQELPEEDMKQEIYVPEDITRQNTSYEGEYEAIVIDGIIADVILITSPDGRISVDYQNNGDTNMQQKYRFYQYEANGRFYVGVKDCGERTAGKKIMLFGKTILSYDNVFRGGADIQLTVCVPAGMPVVEVATISGDVEAKGINARQLEMKTTSGDIVLTDVQAEILHLQASSGDIACSNMNAKTVTAGTGSGDIEIVGKANEYHIKSGSGDVEVRAEGKSEVINVTTGSGDVDMDLAGVGDTEIHAAAGSGECTIYGACGERHQVTCGSITVGSGACKVTVHTGSGDSEIRCR